MVGPNAEPSPTYRRGSAGSSVEREKIEHRLVLVHGHARHPSCGNGEDRQSAELSGRVRRETRLAVRPERHGPPLLAARPEYAPHEPGERLVRGTTSTSAASRSR